MDDDLIARARRFLESRARLLERRVFEAVFEEGDADAVVAALRAYKNPDGGFGHALEPDLRTSASQPIFVEFALITLRQAAAEPGALLEGVVDFLESVSTPEGALSPALPGAADRPCAEHWRMDWATTPQLNPTAGIAGRLHSSGVRHPWIDRATRWCLERLSREAVTSAHTMACALALLDARPDQSLLGRLRDQLPACEWYQPEVPVVGYGVTPLKLAPTPAHAARGLFPDDLIEAHLDDLVDRQLPDGGWPISWDPPGPAAVWEWRGRWTLEALLALRSYGRI